MIAKAMTICANERQLELWRRITARLEQYSCLKTSESYHILRSFSEEVMKLKFDYLNRNDSLNHFNS